MTKTLRLTRSAWAVGVAAFLPLPYSVSTWTAGALGVRYHWVAAASLLRYPKTALYLWLIASGWSIGIN